jgi:hypothetical protein
MGGAGWKRGLAGGDDGVGRTRGRGSEVKKERPQRPLKILGSRFEGSKFEGGLGG